MAQIKVNARYSKDGLYDYETRLERINLDKARREDVTSGNGFIVSSSKAIKEDVKLPNGIFSPKYGPGLQDANAFGNRYRCKCGHTTQRFYHGLVCPICGEKVEFKDDNFSMFGYICLKDPYYLIHPNLFNSLAFFIGEKDFLNIITPCDKKDEDGHTIPIVAPKDEPFYGIGMMEFHDRFDEIMDYYHARRTNKNDYYENIMADYDKVFTQSIPVFTIHLRPYRIDGGTLHFESTNAIYNLMARMASHINDDKTKMSSKRKPKNQMLFELQEQFKKLYDELTKILSGKKGTIRQLFGGRYNFTARSVIVPGPELRIDEVALSYPCLCGLLQQQIINILHKTYAMRYNDAYKMLNESMHEENPVIKQIIEGIIKSHDRGIPILINRNPTITYGGILAMYCTEISTGYTMAVPLAILEGLAADFDGDTLNILLIINKDFETAANYVFNPRNAMYISKNDGMFNNSYNHKRDTIINMNTLVQLSRIYYTDDQISRIKQAQTD